MSDDAIRQLMAKLDQLDNRMDDMQTDLALIKQDLDQRKEDMKKKDSEIAQCNADIKALDTKVSNRVMALVGWSFTSIAALCIWLFQELMKK